MGIEKKNYVCIGNFFCEFSVAWLLWILCYVGYYMYIHLLLFMFFHNIRWQEADEVLSVRPCSPPRANAPVSHSLGVGVTALLPHLTNSSNDLVSRLTFTFC